MSTAPRPGPGGMGRAVRAGDGQADGQAEPVSIAVPDPLGAGLPEGWNSSSTSPGGISGPVADGYDSAPGGQGRADLRLAAGNVVPDGVHPNTCRYRLARAERVADFSLTDPDQRLLLCTSTSPG